MKLDKLSDNNSQTGALRDPVDFAPAPAVQDPPESNTAPDKFEADKAYENPEFMCVQPGGYDLGNGKFGQNALTKTLDLVGEVFTATLAIGVGLFGQKNHRR